MKALLLLAFGGPRSLEEVEPFLTRLFKGRRPSPELLERIKERYQLIGGFSPLPGITWAQAKGLAKKLNEKGYSFKPYVGMRYGHPLIEETLIDIAREGIKEIVAIPMAPFRSCVSTGAYIEEVNRAQEDLGMDLEISFIEGWYSHPLFVQAVREKIEEGLLGFAPEERKGIHLIFTAHSLPKSTVEKDPYPGDMEESVKKVLEGMEPFPWHIAFQSKGGGPEEWIGPEVEKVLDELVSQKVKEVLLVPIGFVADHIEILYDIDITFQKKADSLGMILKRTRSLNASERFIEALASVVEENLKAVRFS
ncbi:MAG TPA: ferrochelatase [Thermodesulfobacteriota bacterium]|nr:ferrochelatase [Thermodesulfobacteriota bacterium]